MTGDGYYARSVAERVFAKELAKSTVTIKDSMDKKAPVFVLTPTGAKCNRVLLVGVAVDKEDVGKDEELWSMVVTDPTGSVKVTAGKYSQDAMAQIRDLELPCRVAIVGKLRTYTSDKSGKTFVSVNAESVRPAETESVFTWNIDTANATISRIRELEAGTSENAKSAKISYSPDIAEYKEMVKTALDSSTKDDIDEVDLRTEK